FGFTCGVEWLAAEKIRVHSCTGLNWDSADNIVPELAQLNKLISDHPCFFDGAKLTRLSPPESPIYALLRESAEGKDSVLVLVNTDVEKSHLLALAPAGLKFEISKFQFDLLGQPLSQFAREKDQIIFTLAPGACHCLAPTQAPTGLSGENYRLARAQAAWAIEALSKIVSAETIDGLDWCWLAEQVERSPGNFLVAAGELAARESNFSLADLLIKSEAGKIFPRVVTWTLIDAHRVTLVPPGCWLLIEDSAPFRAELRIENAGTVHVQSISAGKNHVAAFAPREISADGTLVLERYATTSHKISAAIRFLPPAPKNSADSTIQRFNDSTLVLLTNGIGGMARLCVDLGRVNSKYDCALGANLNPDFPVDRHVFVKRIRVWVNADGFLSPLDFENLVEFRPGPPAVWNFVANAGDGRTVEIELRAEMLEGKNTTVFQFSRPTEKLAHGKQLPADADVRLTVRFDIEDRNFHSETKRNGGADFHFSTNTRTLDKKTGFAFTPAPDRQLQNFSDSGEYHPQPEWCENIPHPVEQTRGQVGSGDAYSPGWFEIPLAKGATAILAATADANPTTPKKIKLEPSKNDFETQLE
ncbi:MAG TPA: glycogen debranching enzyme N-terminal domain-containing protein, partial [Candidatus Baltobacteraceae bacterium]|nr:glycogen debranching enzyme N-terminal domain-containing protein [Candidatus Baltobacteraceae bacterium]